MFSTAARTQLQPNLVELHLLGHTMMSRKWMKMDMEVTILEKVTRRFHPWRVLRILYCKTVSHAFSRSKIIGIKGAA
jgi:hypothetical protein